MTCSLPSDRELLFRWLDGYICLHTTIQVFLSLDVATTNLVMFLRERQHKTTSTTEHAPPNDVNGRTTTANNS